MAESIVVASIEWIGSLLIQEATTLVGVADEIVSLKEKLELLQEYLRDADAKSKLGEQVRVLTAQAKKLAYDAEDLIDIYILHITPKTQLSERNWVVKSARFMYKAPRAYRLGKLMQRLQSEVNKVMEKLEKQEVKRTSHLEERTNWRQNPPRASYPYEEGEFLVGWEQDIKKLVEVLMGQSTNEELYVVWIVGMGGCGKTTLARKLYNHAYVKECFNCWAWVYISQEWSPQQVLLEILRQVVGPGCRQEINPLASKEELVDRLRSILKKKSYLVVLDDVWRRMALQDIFPALPHSKGSKIIVTSRIQEITQFKLPQSSYIYQPSPLDEDQGWKLVSKFTLNHNQLLDVQSYEKLGKEMLKQCHGLPLAIVALAGILSSKKTIGEWQEISDTVLTRVMEGTCMHMSDKVEHILAISYDDLPYYLKPCFLHLAVFPEDCQIPAGMLTRMWIAEGLVTAHKEISVEEAAKKCLQELSHRFMVQVVKTNFKKEIKAVCLHDLLRDFCVKKASEESFLKILCPNELVGFVSPVATHSRRAALHSSTALPAQASHLRSLVLLTRSSIFPSAYESKEVLDMCIIACNFKLLRVLSLWGITTSSGALPKEIGILVHLRYLGIRATNITKLPTSLGSLRNLLTLDYRNVDSDDRNVSIKIPNILWKLILLRHLFLPINYPWGVSELKLSTLTNLQSLWGLNQEARESHWFTREMTMLSTTLKKLRVIVSTEDDLRAVFSCPSLKSNGRLHTLHCELRNHVRLEKDVIGNHLSDNHQLHKLILIGNICRDLSLLLPANLIRLELKDSVLEYGNPMSAIGALAHLRLLKLSNFDVGTSFKSKFGSFPQLEELYLENLQNVYKWMIQQGAMRCLKKLEIVRCWNLDFPEGLVFITTLQQLEFSGMPKKFSQTAREYGWSSKRITLAHNCELIIEESDIPVDTSSIRKLYEQLAAGIFLNNKKQKYWVTNQGDCYYNCFMVYASDLQLSHRGTSKNLLDVEQKLNRSFFARSRRCGDGTLMEAVNLRTQELEVAAKFSTANLSLEVTYEIAWVIKIIPLYGRLLLDDELDTFDDENLKVYTKLTFPNGSIHSHQETAVLHKWIQVPVGLFVTSPDITGDLELSLDINSGTGLFKVLIRGFFVMPEASLCGSQLASPIASIFEAQDLTVFGDSDVAFGLEYLLSGQAEELGKGTFGTTYKAAWEYSTPVVVKRLKEVRVRRPVIEQQMEKVGNINHENVVALKAYYYSNDEMLMVYDYFSQGSLSRILHGRRGQMHSPPVIWETRIRTAIGAAKGIAHLHSEIGGNLVHGNIKSSNIFLNHEKFGCVSDLGLATICSPLAPQNQEFMMYKAPEVTDSRKATQASDVYSFGVVLLELLTGRSPMWNDMHIVEWVQSVIRKEATTEVFDRELLNNFVALDGLQSMLKLGLYCAKTNPEKRPKMANVATTLEHLPRLHFKPFVNASNSRTNFDYYEQYEITDRGALIGS